MLIFRVPARYTAKDASPEDKEIFEQFKATVERAVGRGVIVLPSDRDPDSKQYLFDIEVLD